MFANVVAWYAKRIVNVNINIILAGILALGPVLVCVKIAEFLLSSGLVKNQHLQAHHKAVISLTTFVSDIIFDVGIYFVLHWLANHYPKRLKIGVIEQRIEGVADAAAENVPFFKDAAKVQLQRAVLSPLLYFLWLGSQFVFMNVYNWPAVWATVVGFCIGIGTARSLHTFWMLREEQKRCAVSQGRICGKCGCDLRAIPCEGSGVCPECGKGFLRPVVVDPASGNGAAQSLSEKGVKSVSRS